jgi:hypothetical protein
MRRREFVAVLVGMVARSRIPSAQIARRPVVAAMIVVHALSFPGLFSRIFLNRRWAFVFSASGPYSKGELTVINAGAC